MNIFTITAVFAFLVSLFLSLFVYIKSYHNPKRNVFIAIASLAGTWCLFPAVAALFASNYQTLIAVRVVYIAALFCSPAFLALSLSMAEVEQKKIEKKLLFLSYIIAALFLPFLFSPLMITGVIKFQPYFTLKIGKVYPIFILFFAATCFYSFYTLFKVYKKSYGLKRNQIKYVFLAYFFAFLSAVVHFGSAYGLKEIFPHDVLVIICMALLSYAIVAHRLMDIGVVIKKTLVFASLFAIVFSIFVGVTLLLQQVIGASNKILGFALSSLVIVLTVRPLEIFLIRITDKYLFQKKYDYKHLIGEFMDELKTTVLNTNDVAQSTVDFLNTSIRPNSAAILMFNKFTNKYDLVASSNFKDKDFKISSDNSLVKRLSETGKIININRDKLITNQEKKQFAGLDMEIVLPLLIHKELIGILCLGKKKSDEDYGEDDIEALSDLSGALSISLNNAQLFDERADAEKRALVGTIATGINHEIGNPLNIITIKLDTFRILAREGLLAHKTKEEIIDEVDNITKVCLDSAQRIAEITKQVSEFAKPDKKLIFGKVNVGEAIDETIAFLKHGMILDSEKIEKRIICEPVYVFADRGQLKQILFNLIKNASHAVDKEKSKIIVSVDRNNSDEIAIKIIDNGYGMPKEIMDRLFTPFFTTKDPGKGTGLGLALVKIMIDRNNGRIKVESEEGVGTTFTLIFKGGLL
ncbi:MAG: ATP-binding protein [Candidatus Omnitrophota bacterium]|jgi:signal transduction histidine kinase